MNSAAPNGTSHIWPGIEWAWFDLDDTLYDFRASSLIALNSVYDSMRLNRFFHSRQSWIDTYHRHNDSLWKLYNAGGISKNHLKMERFRLPLTEAGADNATATSLSEALDPEYLRLLASTGLTLPGAHRLLKRLREMKIHIGILSNGFTEVQHDKLRNSKLDRLVDCVVLSDEIGINKPDRRLFDYALQKSGASAASSLMIGDNPDTDIAGAINAGWKALLFNPSTDLLLNLQPST